MVDSKEEHYLGIFLGPISKSKDYRPKFGHSGKKQGYTFDEFARLYGADPFYSWIGLDTELMYTAHRAAGGMTSVYRQIGIGCERLFRQIVIDTTGYADHRYAAWSYTAKTKAGREKVLSLDARLELAQIRNPQVAANVERWIRAYCEGLGDVQVPPKGAVFEVRQGYKSKDSKRQNADIDNAAVAWASGYLPVFAVFSSQIDADIVLRYRNSKCGVIVGDRTDDPTTSLYAFTAQVLGYDLAGFFERNSLTIKKQVHEVLAVLLSTR